MGQMGGRGYGQLLFQLEPMLANLDEGDRIQRELVELSDERTFLRDERGQALDSHGARERSGREG